MLEEFEASFTPSCDNTGGAKLVKYTDPSGLVSELSPSELDGPIRHNPRRYREKGIRGLMGSPSVLVKKMKLSSELVSSVDCRLPDMAPSPSSSPCPGRGYSSVVMVQIPLLPGPAKVSLVWELDVDWGIDWGSDSELDGFGEGMPELEPVLGSRGSCAGSGLSEKNSERSNMELSVEEVWELGAEEGWEEVGEEEAGAVKT